MMRTLATMIALLACSNYSIAHEYLTFEELSETFGYDFDDPTIRSEPLGDGLHVLFGYGGNIVVSIGDQGVLMVDSQFSQMLPAIRETISGLGGDGIDFTINTHWHFDHADGNPTLGRDGSWIVSQINSRRMMAGKHAIDLVTVAYEQSAYPDEAMPVITFTDHMQFHFNGQTVDLFHFGPAHTTGDTAVYFRDSNVVHMGDVFNAGYPFIDAGNGGDLDGMIRFCKKVRSQLDDNSILVPGHGPVMDYGDLENYIDMLETVRDRISTMIHDGKSLEEVIAAEPTSDFDEKYGDPLRMIDRAYMSLSR